MKLTNELIAEKVMGWALGAKVGNTRWVIDPLRDKSLDTFILPNFKDDWNAMKLVIEKVQEDGWRFESNLQYSHGTLFYAGLHNILGEKGHGINKSFPTAVCIAALSAKGIEVEL